MERQVNTRRRSSPAAFVMEKVTEEKTKESNLFEKYIKLLTETSISEMAWFQQLWGALDFYGHTITVKVITAATLGILYLYVSGTSLFNLNKYDPVVVDHVIAGVAISCPLIYSIMLNMYYSDVDTSVGLTLLTLRVTCCCIFGVAITVFLAECFTRRILLSIVLMGYGSWGFFYAWSVPIWRWYVYDVRREGLIAYLPTSLQDTLMRMTLLEWLTDTSFIDNMRHYFPFFLPLDGSEQKRVVESLPSDTQEMMKKPGLIHLLPPSVQIILLPDSTASTMTSSSSALLLDNRQRDSRANNVQPISTVVANVGFEFQKQNDTAIVPSNQSNIMSEIINNKITSTVLSIVQMPSPKILNRTAAISSFLFALQMSRSPKARVHFMILLRVASMALLGSIACTAVSIRAIQILTSLPSSRKYISLVQEIWLRSQNQRLLTNGDGSKTGLVSAAKYSAAAFAVVWAFRKLRN